MIEIEKIIEMEKIKEMEKIIEIEIIIEIEKIFNKNRENRWIEKILNIFKVRMNREKARTDLKKQLSTNNWYNNWQFRAVIVPLDHQFFTMISWT